MVENQLAFFFLLFFNGITALKVDLLEADSTAFELDDEAVGGARAFLEEEGEGSAAAAEGVSCGGYLIPHLLRHVFDGGKLRRAR